MDNYEYFAAATVPARPVEGRALSLENPSVSIADPEAFAAAFQAFVGPPTRAREPVTVATALSLSALWGALKLLSHDTARVPLGVLTRTSQAPTPAEHYLNDMIDPVRGDANGTLTWNQLMRRAIVQAALYEQAFIWLDWRRGKITGFHLLLSDRSTIIRSGGRLWVVTELGDGAEERRKVVAYPYDEILHVEGLNAGGPNAHAAITAAREDIANALASRNFKGAFFAEGMHSGGILQAPVGASPVAVGKMEDAIKQHRRNRQFETLVLEDGFRWFQVQQSLEQAQLTQVDEAGLRDVCRRFLMPPSRMALSGSVSYNSLEQERRDYYDTAVQYWVAPLVAQLNHKALTAAERRSLVIDTRLNLALLYATGLELANLAANAVNARDHAGRSLMNRDEGRRLLGLPPEDNGSPPPPLASPAAAPESRARVARSWLRVELQRQARRVAARAQRNTAAHRWEPHLERLEAHHAAAAAAALELPARAAGRDGARLAAQLLAEARARLAALPADGRDPQSIERAAIAAARRTLSHRSSER